LAKHRVETANRHECTQRRQCSPLAEPRRQTELLTAAFIRVLIGSHLPTGPDFRLWSTFCGIPAGNAETNYKKFT
jgi:hypothetical protein